MLQRKSLAVTMLALCALQTFAPYMTAAKPVPGKKGAYGAGLLSGALAGAMVGHVISSHHHRQKQQQQQSQPPASPITTIERGETLSNGCYKQIVKEPNPYDARQFTETVHLVCPPGVQAVSAVQVAPVAHVAPAVQPVHIGFVPAPVEQQVNVSMQPIEVQPQEQPQHPQMVTINVPPEPAQPATLQVQQQQPQHPALVTFNAPPAPAPAQMATVQVQQPQQQSQPVIITASNPPQAPANPQVFVLSKKQGYFAKSAANDRLKFNFALIILMAMIFIILH